MDINSLERFTVAQKYSYASALCEIRNGEKITHWMWYIFPQLRGLGRSEMAYFYGIADLNEARAYLAHPVLSARLREITETLLEVEGRSARQIFGVTDALKLRSSMTLFSAASDDPIYRKVLDKYFDSTPDHTTLRILGLLT